MRDEIDDLQTVPAEPLLDRPGAGHSRLSSVPPVAPPALGEIDIPGHRLLDRVLRICGVGHAAFASAREAARINRSDIGAELIALGVVSEQGLSQAVAECLGIPHEPIAATDQIILDPAAGPVEGMVRYVKTCDGAFRTKLFLMPMLETLAATAELLDRHPHLRNVARVTTASEIRAHFGERTIAERAAAARLGLAGDRPRQSARSVLDGGQGLFLGTAAVTSLLAATAHPVAFFLAVHAVSALMFFACVVLRLLAAFSLLSGRSRSPELRRPQPEDGCGAPPVYSVLVALYREDGVVASLVESLKRLEWPASRLEIKLVCEGDDTATILAAERATSGAPHFEVVVVPPSEPRTKPKALNFALPLIRGEFVVLYDAEDDPHPRQLVEAFETFRGGGERLACLQAPLTIRNGDESWLAGLFALEYAALFHGLLPWLSRCSLPLPLGGTSNHFSALM